MVSDDSTVRDEKEKTEEVSALSHNENNELNRVATLLETPGNLRSSWKLLEKLFSQFPLEISWKMTGSPGSVISEFFEVSVVLMRKKMVLPRIMSRMASLITFKHCHSLVNLISVWTRFLVTLSTV